MCYVFDRADDRPVSEQLEQQARMKQLRAWIDADNEAKRTAETLSAPLLWRDELFARHTLIYNCAQGFYGKIPYSMAVHLRSRNIGSDRLISHFRIVITKDGSVWEALSKKEKEVTLGTLLVPPVSS